MRPTVLVVALFLCLCGSACAQVKAPMWGPIGHAVTAQIATSLLPSDVVDAAQKILGGVTMASVASWADQVKHTAGWEWSAALHFINTPAWSCDFKYPRDCADDICVAGAIKNYTYRLSTDSAQSDQAIDLKFLIHFVGDIHQPLHCGFGVDKGGNLITGTFFGYNDNLHSIWDTYIIYDRIHNDFGGDQTQWFDYIMKQIQGPWASNVTDWQKCSNSTLGACPDEWGDNSADLACTYAYTDSTGSKVENGFNLGDPYFQFTKGVVDMQLAKGGVRLAKTLNAILGNGEDIRAPVRWPPVEILPSNQVASF